MSDVDETRSSAGLRYCKNTFPSKRANGTSQSACAGHVVDRAQGVRCRPNGHQFGPYVDLLLEIVPIERAVFDIHAHDAERATTFASQRLPRTHIRVVVQLGDNDLVVRGEMPP